MRGRESQRETAAVDVGYEINALAAAWQRHSFCGFAWTAWFVHARNLSDFFDNKTAGPDDVLARDFFDPPGNWDAICERITPPADLPKYLIAADKLAAHLTYSRLDYRPTGTAPSLEVTEYLLDLAGMFKAALTHEHRSWVEAAATPTCGEASSK